MNYLIKIKLLLMISLLAFSCGKKTGSTNGKISIISGFSAISSQFQGGVALFVRNLDTGHVLTKNVQDNNEEIVFDNGRYEFLIMGWDGTQPMTGTASCDNKDSVVLNGEDITLNFNLKSSSCDTLATKSGPLFFHSNVMGGNIPAVTGDYSVRLTIPQFNGVPSTKYADLPTESIGSTCLSKDSANSSLNLNSSNSFPVIDLPVVAQVFDGKLDCTGIPTRLYILPKGLDEDNAPYTVNSINVPLDDLVFSVRLASGDSFTLPFIDGAYTYNLNVDWGDGETTTVNSWDAIGATHSYSATDEYIVRVSGTAQAFSCNGSTSCNKIDHVLNFGDLGYKYLQGAFKGTTSLLSLSGGKTSNVTDMSSMFYDASSLISLDLSSLDTSSVSSMNSMFSGASGLSSLDLSGFETSSVTTMSGMFRLASSLTSLNLSGFDTSSVESMSSMFSNASGLSSIDLSGFDTSSVTNMANMFYQASSLTFLDLTSFDTSTVTNMSGMFELAPALAYLNISSFDTSSVESMSKMFRGLSSLTSLDLSSFNTSSVTNMYAMFNGSSILTTLDLSNFDTSSVTDMNGMFNDVSGLTSLDLSSFDTSYVTDMSSMFYNTTGLTTLDLTSFNTSSVTDMYRMFDGVSGLTSLDLSNFDTSYVENMKWMFRDTTSLASLNLNSWNIAYVTDSTEIFLNTNGSLVVGCNNQDIVSDGSGVLATGTIFGETCN